MKIYKKKNRINYFRMEVIYGLEQLASGNGEVHLLKLMIYFLRTMNCSMKSLFYKEEAQLKQVQNSSCSIHYDNV